MQKIERVLEAISQHFGNPKVKMTANVVKFNIKQLSDSHVIALGVISTDPLCLCDVEVKRSDAGLVVIITC